MTASMMRGMDSIIYPLIAALFVMSMSLVGVFFAMGRLGNWMRTYLTYLATFSGGVFLLIAYHLAEEAVHEGGWLVGVTSVLIGALIMEGLQYILPTSHHHHGHSHDHAHTPLDGRGVLLSDALHNIGDGILLVGAFATNWYIGLAATVGVLVHEAVQEISEFFVLKEAGYSTRGALVRNFAVSSTILIGLLFATFLSSMEPFLALLSGIAAGGFLSVIMHDLLPHAIASIRAHGGASKHVIAALAGAGLMLGIQTLFPHEEAAEMEVSTPAVVETISQKVESAVLFTPPPVSKQNPVPPPPPSTSASAQDPVAPPPAGAADEPLSSEPASGAAATSSPQTPGTRN